MNPVSLECPQYLEDLLRLAFLRYLGVQLHRRDPEFQDFLLNLVVLDYLAVWFHRRVMHYLADPLRQLIRDCLPRFVVRLRQEFLDVLEDRCLLLCHLRLSQVFLADRLRLVLLDPLVVRLGMLQFDRQQ